MSKASSAVPLVSKKEIRRESIFQAAIEVFSRNSFQEASISEIAGKANVAEGTIYQYFKNKEDLFFSIPVEKTREFCEQLDLHLEGISGAVNKIRKFVWYYLYFFKANPQYGRILMLEVRVNKSFVKTKCYNSFRKSTARILEIIKEGQDEGVIRKDADLYLLRQLILGVLEHMVTRWLLKGETYDLVQPHNEVSRLVINGIAQP
jgi:TetR/AcrR family transcriptional regulator, fatty acid metabolism regulator protein